ncbi:MAG TPA: DUF5666 domain-containing protein [Anaerolineae bacterium]|nr:DUF5666 domain-containing protein [Anaerolineae bacterium]
MTNEDLLQERLARLEAGEPLEACFDGLPEEQADLLRTAGALRSIRFPSRSTERVAAQRAGLMRAAKEQRAPAAGPGSHISLSTLSAWLVNRLRTLPRPAAVALTGLAILALMAGVLILRQPPQAEPNAVSVTSSPAFSVYIPAVSSVLSAPDPQSAIVSDMRGIIETQSSDGTWAAVKIGQTLSAGQRVRAGDLSAATLLFFDGSQVRLSAASEISIDELDARLDAARVVRLTQSSGESRHDVKPSSVAGSQYEVRTPNGTGVAKGTSFHVVVTSNFIARFNVDEGTVAVTNLNVTVNVVAGQSTTVYVDEPPSQPIFRISGEGRVTQMGDVWTIGGRDFLVNTTVGPDNSTTEIVGDPQIGDWVFVEGRILPGDSYFADRIVLLHRAEENRFAFTGEVEAMGDEEWTISGRVVDVDDETDIEDGIALHDLVRVEGVIQSDGTLLAERIRLVVTEDGLPFEFVGVVESIGDETWTISGVEIAIGDRTVITGDPGLGDIVKVKGHILADGTWLADEIRLAEEDERRFEFTGTVEQIDPWVVSGVHFDTSLQTVIDDNIDVGDRVRVEGRVLDDGIWLAEKITLLDEDEPRRFEFVGRVSRIDPWVIGGLDIAVDDATLIDDDIDIGDMVRVKGVILPDGTLLAESITLVDDDLGCSDITGIVIRIDGNRIVLDDGQTLELGEDVEISGDLRTRTVIIVRICIRADGTLVVVSVTVIIHLQPPAPPPLPDDDDDQGGKVTICHIPSGNPDARHTIEVDQPAVATHLGHGDYLGPCRDGGGDDDDDDDDGGGGSGGGAFVITENNQTLTLTCNGHSVTINGNDNTITLLGTCSSITIRGNSNWVSIQAAASITNTGNNNVIQQR